MYTITSEDKVKIAVSSDGNNPESKVSNRFNSAEYVVIFDTATGEYDAVPNPFASGQYGAGVQAVVMAVRQGADVVLTGYASPSVVGQFKAGGIDVGTGFTGTVKEAVEQYRNAVAHASENQSETAAEPSRIDKTLVFHAFRAAFRQFVSMVPVMAGIILLTGLFDVFVSEKILMSIFSGNIALDTLWGACFGSIFAGNPINSYIIGGELLTYGVSLFAVTAFIVTWVTVGLVQLPAEIAAFGRRFAFLRNGLSFVSAILISLGTVAVTGVVTGWIMP
jgi:predicted Fe-Mo cluster-binding NifX family protein